jgi:myxalamid-type polyketide synthase MxaB
MALAGVEHADDFVAIVGMSLRVPGASSVDEFWRNLRSGAESIRDYSDEELIAAGVAPAILAYPGYVKVGGTLTGTDLFDAGFFRYLPREAEVIDPQHRLFLECAHGALEAAGCARPGFEGRVGVYAGCRKNYYLITNVARSPEVLSSVGIFQAVIGNDRDYLTTRVSYKLDLRGPSFDVQTACSTSLVAVAIGCEHLLNHQCDVALAGGAAIRFPQGHGYFAEDGGMLSPDGRARAFDRMGQGTIFSDGVGVVALKRLRDALADGDPIHAVIRGFAVNNDGADRAGFTAPGVAGQVEAIAAAQAMARVEAQSIGYVEAHGTGTPVGDPIEIAALSEVFRQTTAANGFCGIGSLKTNLGHMEQAAGVASLIKVALMLEKGEFVPSLHFEEANPEIDFERSPFFVTTEQAEWVQSGGPRRAAVSSFGFGGTNAHVVLEQPPARAASPPAACQVIVLSAKSESALAEASRNLADHLERDPDLNIGDVARTQNVTRRHYEWRRSLVVADARDAAARLRDENPRNMVTGRCADHERTIAFAFPGQGSQYPGMARGLYESEPVFREVLDECAERLVPELGLDLRELIFPDGDDSGERLRETSLTQPSVFAVDLALARLWVRWGVKPRAMIGHSLGEYVAACVAGVFELPDALRLVAVRGRLMQELERGSMLSISLGEAEVRDSIGGAISLAAVNGPALCTVSGPTPAIEVLERELESREIACERLHTSHAFHSAMMDPMLPRFAEALKDVRWQKPAIAYVSNLTGTWIQPEEAVDPAYWLRHLREPVRFADGIETLVKGGTDVFLETGPGRALTNLTRLSVSEDGSALLMHSLPHAKAPRDDRKTLLDSLGRLAVAGVPIAWQELHSAHAGRTLTLPGYPFQRRRYHVEASAGGGLDTILGNWGHATTGSGHPLLGERVDGASPSPQFEARIGMSAPAFLGEHRVHGVPVVPGTSYIECALAAASQVTHGKAFAVLDARYHEALFLGEGISSRLAVSLTRGREDDFQFHVYARPEVSEAESDGDEWQVHATGRIRRLRRSEREAAESGEDPASVLERMKPLMSGADFYGWQRGRGYDYGPRYQSIRQLWAGEDEVLGELQVPDVLAAELDRHQVHPALLDACVQVMLAWIPSDLAQVSDRSVAYVPTGVEELRFHGGCGGHLWSHVRVRSGCKLGDEVLLSDVRVFDDSGRTLLELIGYRNERISSDFQRALAHRVRNLLYEIRWTPHEPTDLADAGSAGSAPDATWLILADESGLGDRLAEELGARGARCRVEHRSEQARDVTADASRPSAIDPVESWISELARADGTIGGVIDLWPLDARNPAEPDAASWSRVHELACLSQLRLAQALLQNAGTPPPPMWVVTRGAQRATPEDRVPTPAQAPVWGLGRVIDSECPELRCVRLDLDAEASDSEIDCLLDLLSAAPSEPELALRGSTWLVPRLQRYSRAGGASVASAVKLRASESPVFGLACEMAGSVDGLALLPRERVEPGPGQVEVEVVAAGVNFRDVLQTMGMYPGTPEGPFFIGGECAGRISRVGPDVEGLRVGDEVMAIAPNAIGTHATTLAGLVAKKPEGIGFAEAAGIPNVFLTTYFALCRVAQLRRGERVLIHSAAGGVGLSAIQIAKSLGATILATVGNDEKKKLLESIGVDCIMDSRKLDWAEEVMARTDGEGVDVVLNSLSGEAIPKGLGVLRRFGRFLDLTRNDIFQNAQIGLFPFHKNLSYHAIDLAAVFAERPDETREMFEALAAGFRDGRFEPLPVQKFAIEEAPAAFMQMIRRANIGKLVILPGGHDREPDGESRSCVRAGASYLVSGGLGALGLRFARWLAEQGAGRIVLSGRRPPSQQAEEAIRALGQLGCRVEVAIADVADPGAVANLAELLRNGPELRGVIHAAGVLDDGAVLEQTAQRFETVLAPKAAGAWNLHRFTEKMDLDFFVMFSSASAILGTPGQANYAAANAFLDALAQHRRGLGLPATSVAWGAWAEIGMAARVYAESGLLPLLEGQMIRPTEGVEALRLLIDDRASHTMVFPATPEVLRTLPGGPQRPLLRALLGDEAASGDALVASGRLYPRPDLGVEYIAPRTELEQTIVDVWKPILGFEEIGVRDGFVELGGHSLLAQQVAVRLQRLLSVRVKVKQLLEVGTIEALASQIEESLLERLDELSEEEAAAQLEGAS